VCLEKSSGRLVLIVTAFFICLALSRNCYAQITPDTTYSGVTQDTAMVKVPRAGTWVPKPADKTDTAVTEVAATDSIPDSLAKAGPFQPNPKKSGMYSAILPGLGQLYNKQYWKVPVVYVGLAVAGYFIVNNLSNYRSYRQAYVNRINNPDYIDKYTGVYDEAQLQQLQNDYSKYLDITVLITSIAYVLQVLDAVTSAHLKNFDISRDISMRMKPVIYPTGAGIGLVMNFKR
jgi:hypothetical protein